MGDHGLGFLWSGGDHGLGGLYPLGPVALGDRGRRWGLWPGGELWLGGGTVARGLWPGGGHTRTLRTGAGGPCGSPCLPRGLSRGSLGPWRAGLPLEVGHSYPLMLAPLRSRGGLEPASLRDAGSGLPRALDPSGAAA